MRNEQRRFRGVLGKRLETPSQVARIRTVKVSPAGVISAEGSNRLLG